MVDLVVPDADASSPSDFGVPADFPELSSVTPVASAFSFFFTPVASAFSLSARRELLRGSLFLLLLLLLPFAVCVFSKIDWTAFCTVWGNWFDPFRSSRSSVPPRVGSSVPPRVAGNDLDQPRVGTVRRDIFKQNLDIFKQNLVQYGYVHGRRSDRSIVGLFFVVDVLMPSLQRAGLRLTVRPPLFSGTAIIRDPRMFQAEAYIYLPSATKQNKTKQNKTKQASKRTTFISYSFVKSLVLR